MKYLNNITKIVSGSFFKSILLVSGGTAFAQVVNGLLSPLITRLYSPEDYGILTAYTSILSMLSVIGAFKYEWGIPIADDDENAIQIVHLSLIVILFFCLLIAVFFYFGSHFFLPLFNGESLSNYIYLIPLGVLLTGIYNIFTEWAYRKKNFKDISKTKIGQSIAQNIIIISFGLVKAGAIGLLIGRITGQANGISILVKYFVSSTQNIKKKIKIKEMFYNAKRYINFPLFSAPSQILNSAGIQLPALFVLALYGPEVIGYYGLANSIVNLPMNLIGRSVSDVFYAEAASLRQSNPKRLKLLCKHLLIRLMILGLIPLVTLSIFGPSLFALIFGKSWYEAGIFARIISFLVYARFVFTPVSRIYTVFESQKKALILDISRVILMLLAFGIAKIMGLSSYWAIILYPIAMCIIYLMTYFFSQLILNEAIKKT